MSTQDPISNMLTIIRNGQLAKKNSIIIFYSKIKYAILNIILKEGYIKNFYMFKEKKINKIVVHLKYFLNNPVITEIVRISKPGLRIYKSYKEFPIIKSGLGVLIISTSLGLLSDKMARINKVGGELICYIF